MPSKDKNPYHHKDLHVKLIQAAISLLPTKGANGLSLREVAKVAGVSHTAPYRHFKDKADLLAAIAQTGFERLSEATAEVVERHIDDPRQQFIEGAVAYVNLGLENPEMVHLMFGGVLNPDSLSQAFYNVADNSFDGLVHIIQAGQEAGLFKSEPPESIALSAWCMAHGLMMLITAGQLQDVAENPAQAEQLSRMLAHNLLTGILK